MFRRISPLFKSKEVCEMCEVEPASCLIFTKEVCKDCFNIARDKELGRIRGKGMATLRRKNERPN